VTLYRLGIVSDNRLVSLGMMTRHKIFAHNNFLADDSLSTPVRYACFAPSLLTVPVGSSQPVNCIAL
jgi:hypothetical protein